MGRVGGTRWEGLPEPPGVYNHRTKNIIPSLKLISGRCEILKIDHRIAFTEGRNRIVATAAHLTFQRSWPNPF